MLDNRQAANPIKLMEDSGAAGYYGAALSHSHS